MDSEFIIKLRRLIGKNYPSNEDIMTLKNHLVNLTKDIEKTVTVNPEIGKRQIFSNLKEILQILPRLENDIKDKVEVMQIARNDESSQFYNTLEVGYTFDNAISCLLELLNNYFPNDAIKNKHLYKKFLPAIRFPFTPNPEGLDGYISSDLHEKYLEIENELHSRGYLKDNYSWGNEKKSLVSLILVLKEYGFFLKPLKPPELRKFVEARYNTNIKEMWKKRPSVKNALADFTWLKKSLLPLGQNL